MSFWNELKRRNVFKVGVAYAIVAWLLAQVASTVFPALHLPAWTVTFVTALLIIGFPLVLIFAWAFEITPEGLKRSKEVPHHESITHITGQKLNYIVTLLLVVAVGFMLVDNYFLDRGFTGNRQTSIDNEAVDTTETIAVLPFIDLSPDMDQEFFVDGLSEEILNSLAQIPNLNVTGRTSSFTFKNSNKTVQEIAGVLGVKNILEGSVRKAGNALRITAQLLRAKDGFHLWSKTYDRELKDIFEVQEDIATAVADELKVKLGIAKSLKPLGGTDNVEAYELYLAAKGQFNNIDWSNRALESIDAAIALDPKFALAWALKASIHQMNAHFAPDTLAASEEQEAGLNAALKAIELEPNLAEAYAALGGNRSVKGEWKEAELAYRKAAELGTESSLIAGNYIPYLFAIGYYDKANKILEEAQKNDPLNESISSMYLNSFIYLGNRLRANQELERALALFGNKPQWQNGAMGLRIYFKDSMPINEILESAFILSDDKKAGINTPDEFATALHESFDKMDKANGLELWNFMLYAAYLNDDELPMNAIEKMSELEATSVMEIWYPIYHRTRQLPRFKKFVREIGLVDYWNEFGWPDLCRPLANGDFVCD